MNKTMNERELGRIKRHIRIRKKLVGTAERPRLSVHRSLKHLYVQVIDDINNKTLASFSTTLKEFAGGKGKMNKVSTAQMLGKNYAKSLKAKGIEAVAFDRGGYKYHGRVKALAEALRQEGIKF